MFFFNNDRSAQIYKDLTKLVFDIVSIVKHTKN